MKKIYGCDKCGYKQDFSPNNQRLMALIFPDYPIGYCPACITGKTPTGEQATIKIAIVPKNINKPILYN